MKDADKTKAQLIKELKVLRQQIAELKILESKCKLAEEALQESEEKLRTQYKGIPVPTYTWQRVGEDFVLVDYNDAAEAITRGKIVDFVGKKAREMYQDKPKILEELKRCFTEKISIKREVLYQLRSIGESKYLVVSYAFLPPDLVLVYTEDSTEYKRAKEALRKSTGRYHSVFAASPDYIYLTDAKGNILDANPALLDRAGLSLEQMQQKNFMDFFAGDNLDELLQAFSKLTKNGQEVKELQIRARNSRGEIFEYEVNAIPLKEDGAVTTILSLARDITERKRAEEALRENEERYHKLFENANDAIATFTLDGTITSVNRGGELMLGWSRQELIGQHYRKVCTPSSASLGEERTRRFLAGEKLPSSTFEAELVRKDGSVVPVEARTRVIRNQEGKPIGFQGIYRDITERKQVEKVLLKAKEGAEAANRAKSEFLAIVSHELRTPLTRIMGYNDLLLEGMFDDLTTEQTDTLQRVNKNAKELLDLINTVLDLSCLEAGRLPIELKEVGVAELIKEVKAETQEMREQSSLEFEWKVDEDVPPIRTDPRKLKMVVRNLIDNAVKFTEKGRITTDTRGYGGGVEISVTDTGIGIPPKALPIIFEPFRQLDNSTTRHYKGTGLGLHVVKRLLELLGGTITVESKVGQGSTFRIWVPRIWVPAGENTAGSDVWNPARKLRAAL
jgi:PAS domain S-box-containing protein